MQFISYHEFSKVVKSCHNSTLSTDSLPTFTDSVMNSTDSLLICTDLLLNSTDSLLTSTSKTLYRLSSYFYRLLLTLYNFYWLSTDFFWLYWPLLQLPRRSQNRPSTKLYQIWMWTIWSSPNAVSCWAVSTNGTRKEPQIFTEQTQLCWDQI